MSESCPICETPQHTIGPCAECRATALEFRKPFPKGWFHTLYRTDREDGTDEAFACNANDRNVNRRTGIFYAATEHEARRLCREAAERIEGGV